MIQGVQDVIQDIYWHFPYMFQYVLVCSVYVPEKCIICSTMCSSCSIYDMIIYVNMILIFITKWRIYNLHTYVTLHETFTRWTLL